MKFNSASCIERHNRTKGYHFFDSDTIRAFGTTIKSGVLSDRWLVIHNRKSPNKAKFRAIMVDDNGGISQLPKVSSQKAAEQQIKDIEDKGYLVVNEFCQWTKQTNTKVFLRLNGCVSEVRHNPTDGYFYYTSKDKVRSLKELHYDAILANAVTFKNNRFYSTVIEL